MSNRQLKKEIKRVEKVIAYNRKIFHQSKAEINGKLSAFEANYWFLFPTAGLIMGWCFCKKSFFSKALLSLGKMQVMDWLEHKAKHLLITKNDDEI
jgi:hypothetical protein